MLSIHSFDVASQEQPEQREVSGSLKLKTCRTTHFLISPAPPAAAAALSFLLDVAVMGQICSFLWGPHIQLSKHPGAFCGCQTIRGRAATQRPGCPPSALPHSPVPPPLAFIALCLSCFVSFCSICFQSYNPFPSNFLNAIIISVRPKRCSN